MGRTGTKRLSLKKEGFELELERGDDGIYKGSESSLDLSDDNPLKNDIAMRRANMPLPRNSEAQVPLVPGASQAAGEKEDITSSYVTSPMVGTFYASPSPDDPSFIKVGDKIDKNTVVCIIEAMKVMNEVKAGVSGTVAEMLVENGHPVEFGTKLFRIS